jgi:hypothetical protein
MQKQKGRRTFRAKAKAIAERLPQQLLPVLLVLLLLLPAGWNLL